MSDVTISILEWKLYNQQFLKITEIAGKRYEKGLHSKQYTFQVGRPKADKSDHSELLQSPQWDKIYSEFDYSAKAWINWFMSEIKAEIARAEVSIIKSFLGICMSIYKHISFFTNTWNWTYVKLDQMIVAGKCVTTNWIFNNQ